MSSLFYRLHPDRSRDDAPLENVFAGPMPSACWLIGGGPSLNRLPHAEIAASPIPKMCLNLAGTRLLRPNFWTSYDPSVRFHRSIYLDAGVMKFVHRRRATDLVPETTFKICECPNTFFFDRDGDRGFADFLSPHNGAIVDWADSMVQAIDILYRLGFRVIYLAGCEMQVQPSAAQRRHARAAGVSFTPGKQLQEFLSECEEAGLSADELDALEPGPHYHFDEVKPIRAAATTDSHYFRVAQYLRLVRRSLSVVGMQLISVTPHSRLNDYFPYRPARRVLRSISQNIGDPTCEPVRGLYRQTEIRHSQRLRPMRDFLPHHWSPEGRPQSPGGKVKLPPNPPPGEIHIEAEGFTRRPLDEKLNCLPADYLDPDEDG
ncbi:MAG: hypothetical protein HOL01_18275 [Planctomycetaceae bacterium]|nr:hypothetical protein [Planctomycetaceae bacterium]MBT6484733.1 hypothetical protein [Planctomycetaceae bacterium]MBT6496483.1 hypothetical protein [Planctomycetaceae bacterium]